LKGTQSPPIKLQKHKQWSLKCSKNKKFGNMTEIGQNPIKSTQMKWGGSNEPKGVLKGGGVPFYTTPRALHPPSSPLVILSSKIFTKRRLVIVWVDRWSYSITFGD